VFDPSFSKNEEFLSSLELFLSSIRDCYYELHQAAVDQIQVDFSVMFGVRSFIDIAA
jgi:hypothetical protein